MPKRQWSPAEREQQSARMKALFNLKQQPERVVLSTNSARKKKLVTSLIKQRDEMLTGRSVATITALAKQEQTLTHALEIAQQLAPAARQKLIIKLLESLKVAA